MKRARIIVLKNSRERPQPSECVLVITFDELREWVKKGAYVQHLFAYREAVLLTYRLDVLVRPFLTALLLRLLSYGGCSWQDETGREEEIGVWGLARLLVKCCSEWISKGRVLRDVRLDLDLVRSRADSRRNGVDLNGRPVYLRTDLSFGIRSGGSVGHTAGVLNQLKHFTREPIFLSTDNVPTVGEDVETHIVLPQNVYWDFIDFPSFHFNRHLYLVASEILRDGTPSFVYQRYSLNDFVGIKLALKFKIPLVLEYNGSEIWIHRHWGRRLKFEALSERIEHLNLNAADLVVVVSQPMKDELVGRGIDGEKILVNPNGVDPERYSPAIDGSLIRKQYDFDGKVVVGFVGTFGMWHGAEILMDAFGQLLHRFPMYQNRVKLLMVGEGLTMPVVKRKIKEWNVIDSTVLTGLVSQEAGPSYLAACDILVSPHVPNPDGSPFFGSPTKLFEYMAMGKGIIASDLNQIGEVLKHDETAWMVTPGDVESLRLGLETLIDDEPRRARLGRAARQEVVAKYTWKEHVRKTIEKLKERCQ